MKQAAALLGVPYTTLRAIVQRGEVPVVKFGDGKRAHWYLKRADLDALIERHTQQAAG